MCSERRKCEEMGNGGELTPAPPTPTPLGAVPRDGSPHLHAEAKPPDDGQVGITESTFCRVLLLHSAQENAQINVFLVTLTESIV